MDENREGVIDLTDPNVRCTRCSAMGAAPGGLCLDCVAREIGAELGRILEEFLPQFEEKRVTERPSQEELPL